MSFVSVAQNRASMPAGANKALDRRSIEKGNQNILPFLKKGMTVMDVGCGAGSITQGIAEKVGPAGKVIGIDVSKELVALAQARCEQIENLSFDCRDIFQFETEERFDLITSARTLQWLSDPVLALRKMKALLNVGGLISILDYNHERIEWNPAPPESMQYFYHQFLAWRKDAGMNNRMADDLVEAYSILDLKQIVVKDASEISLRSDEDFQESAGIWSVVAETRGKQLVTDYYITEQERLEAIDDYRAWLNGPGVYMKMYLLNVSGYSENIQASDRF